MQFLNQARLDAVAHDEFQATKPYPWASIDDVLTAEGHRALIETLPHTDRFQSLVGVKRAHGQAPHDRYLLHYNPTLELPAAWKEFVAELQGDAYRNFLRRVLGPRNYILTFEWHYAWAGCQVSPHCDAARKRATHLFYFNTEEDWDPAWGGQTLILDSDRKFKTHSAPKFDELHTAAAVNSMGNGSLLFQRTPHSWHGVLPLTCPEGKLRKLFSVTINVPNFQVWWRRLRGKDPNGFRRAA